MQKWLAKYRNDATEMLQKECIWEINFSGPTYFVECVDPHTSEHFWPFFQFDAAGELQDAFCSCTQGEKGCVHLAAAYIKILGPSGKPLHLRFKHSFWNVLCQILAEHIGFEGRFLEKRGVGNYFFENDVQLELVAHSSELKKLITTWVEERTQETPDNSIKFSNLSQEEIEWWKDGRPSIALRYILSFWSDLAKWMFFSTESGKVVFEEDKNGLPTLFTVHFKQLTLKGRIGEEDLERIIPTLSTVSSSLKVFSQVEKNVRSIVYDPKSHVFFIDHDPSIDKTHDKIRPIGTGKWGYVSKEGFFSRNGSLLNADRITSENISAFLESCQEIIRSYVAIHEQTVPLSYAFHFDAEHNWHFVAYLFEEGDLLKGDSALFGKWAYLENKGFYRVKETLFEGKTAVLTPSEISSFINQNRVWLNGQAGFETHLAGIETQLELRVTAEGMHFHTQLNPALGSLIEFEDWIYYPEMGFFSKRHSRPGSVVYPGLFVAAKEISRFIHAYHDELELIPHFFSLRQPYYERGLEIDVLSEKALSVKPLYKGEENLLFFGDYGYIDKEGFFEVPLDQRIPTEYLQERRIWGSEIVEFIEEELPRLQRCIRILDPRLRLPIAAHLEVASLNRTSVASLEGDFFYKTELGVVSVESLARAFAEKRRFIFSEGGLIDLEKDQYQWIRKTTFNKSKAELSTLEFLRLDALFAIRAPLEESHIHTTLHELRNLISLKPPNTNGLKSQLRLYQETGLGWLWFLYCNGLAGLLCDEMGLGKTHQAMALIAAILNEKKRKRSLFLVVCPTSVIYHWQDKLTTFLPKIPVTVYHGAKRFALPKSGVIVTSYGILRVEREKFQNIMFDLAIYDEIQVAKNTKSRIHKVLVHYTRARMRLGLTGTPIENTLSELRALFDVVLPGYMPEEAKFKEKFILPIEKENDEEKRALLTQLIRPFILRRRKAQVLQELPEKIENKSYCDLSDEQIRLYNHVLSESRKTVLADLQHQERSINYLHIFSMLTQLKQICDHPALVEKDIDNYKSYPSGKWDLYCELMEEARESDQKVVVFSQYLGMLDIIEKDLNERGWGYSGIRGDTRDREKEIRRFQEDPNCVVFVGSLHAAGVGIDLTAASVVILFDRWWNAAKENQAIDRVHRIGQKWAVQVFKLITKGTIEEKTDLMITRKKRLLEDVLDVDDQAVLKQFTREELLELFTYIVN